MCGLLGSRTETVCEVRKVSVIVMSNLAKRVAAEFLEHGFGKHNGDHCLRNDSHGWDCRDVAALSGGVGLGSRSDVDRGQRPHEGTYWLHCYSKDQRLASRNSTLQPASPIGAPLYASSSDPLGRRLDLVVNLGAGGRGRREAHP